MSPSTSWLILAGLVLTGWLLYLLGPVLSPFLAAALLAYLFDPIVDRIEARKWSRTAGTCVVFVLLGVILTVLLLILIPMLSRQIGILIRRIPETVGWLQDNIAPRITAWTGFDLTLISRADLQEALTKHWQQVGNVATDAVRTITQGGGVLLSWLAFLTIVPVVTFYLLRDWDVLMASIRQHLPRRYEGTI